MVFGVLGGQVRRAATVDTTVDTTVDATVSDEETQELLSEIQLARRVARYALQCETLRRNIRRENIRKDSAWKQASAPLSHTLTGLTQEHTVLGGRGRMFKKILALATTYSGQIWPWSWSSCRCAIGRPCRSARNAEVRTSSRSRALAGCQPG